MRSITARALLISAALLTPIVAIAATSASLDKVNMQTEVYRGNKTARISLVMYTDFECPFCERHRATMADILKKYNGKVNWVYRPFPLSFHVNAEKKAIAAQCVATQKGLPAFWKYHDSLFDKAFKRTGFSQSYALSLAKPLGVNTAAFRKCIKAKASWNALRSSIAKGAELGVTGTPATFIYDHQTKKSWLVSGAVPIEDFTLIIDAVLAGKDPEIDPVFPDTSEDLYPVIPEDTAPPTVTDADHIRGTADAEIVLIEYSDLECPFCMRHHPVMKELLAKYPGRVSWVYRHFPLSFHPKAMPGAIGAECAARALGQSAFWTYVDHAYTNESWTPESAAKAAFVSSDSTYLTCVKEKTPETMINAQMEAGTVAGASGTPTTFIVNRKTGALIKKISGAVPIQTFIDVLDPLLK